MSLLPVELLTDILKQLPGRDPSSLKTVVSFLSANSVARAAALDNALWKHLYQGRYRHNDAQAEEERHARLQGDWRLMYIERFKLDRVALHLVDHIRTHPTDRDAPASSIATYHSAVGIRDALQYETQLPIPRAFRDPEVDDMTEEPVPQALPRRFWTKATLGALARKEAVETWCRLQLDDTGGPGLAGGFEDMLKGLSAFTDVAPSQVTEQLEELTARCRERLRSQDVVIDYRRSGYDLLKLVLAIREFIHDEGFAMGTGREFYHPFNQFPHYFLGPGRRHTIPMSIIYTFCAICRRIGIQAAPTNTPRKVLCHITSPDSRSGNILLDVCSTDPPVVFSSTDLSVMLRESGLPGSFPAETVSPTRLPTLLARVINNIFASMAGLADLDQYDLPRAHTAFRAEYAVTMTFAAVNAGHIHMAPKVADDCPLDTQIVLLNGLVPQIPSENRRERFVADLKAGIAGESRYKILQQPRRRPQDMEEYAFVGRVLSTPGAGKLGCVVVVGWEFDSHGTLKYLILTEHGFQSAYAYATLPEPLTRQTLRSLRKHIAQFDRFFDDVYSPREDGIGSRLIPTTELQQQYPDDLEAGICWSEQQLRIAGDSSAGQHDV
ncbi:hypothetical protein K466DRAFT_644260 [Polyporus arcularius HHB13444]|uniref:F-box domain-containing protein n=1 Tax=Polyporus arcularius HHB13444 TaxID=1314778 RepID=A0A5C3PM53_9APHY|nr:hypothetical protein K466DRAFT_644260 [Polyporus arcularius HHB13444]